MQVRKYRPERVFFHLGWSMRSSRTGSITELTEPTLAFGFWLLAKFAVH